MLTLYNKKDSALVVGGLVFLHCLVAILCAFWIYKFIFLEYNEGVWFLLVLFVGAITICDILICQVQGFRRFLVRCNVDDKGIHITEPGRKSRRIYWEDISVFGITGFSSPMKSGILFLSCDTSEKYDVKQVININNERIVFQVNEEKWNKISVYMPDDIKRKLQVAIEKKVDCFCRR